MSKKQSETNAGRFKRYPKYKDSGVEWLGEIPAHWEVRRLKYVASLNPESLGEDTRPDFEMVYVDIGGVDNLGRIVEREPLTFGAAPSRARRLVRDGDVIVSTVRTYLRAIASINDTEPNLVVSTGFAVVRPIESLTSDYAAYALRTPYFVERVVANSKGVSFPAIDESEVATYDLTIPPVADQLAIASFLDRETARIDALVAKKERLIELLQEKHSALITSAVTKGLDPTVPMKAAGVEWLGQIPAHWSIKRLRWVLKDRPKNGISPAIGPSGTTPTFSIAAVSDDIVSIEEHLKYTMISENEARPFIVRKGDIFLLRGSGSRRLVGNAGIVAAEPPSGCVYPDILIRVRPSASLTPWFLVSCLNSRALRPQVEASAKGASGIWKISAEDVRNFEIPIPPVLEQRQIEANVSVASSRLGMVIAKVGAAVNGLKELRTALISAAVTGRIDIREEVV